jgi:hypothetical protein
MDTKDLIEILVLLVGVIGFIFGVYQYQQAQRWKRLEYAANQLQRLQIDPDLELATTFLDYSERAVSLPEKYWEYTGAHVFNHNCQSMYHIMAKWYENTPEFFIYADAFESLFEYLVQIYVFIDMKLIKADDVKSLKWVLEDLAKPQWTEDNRVFIGRISFAFSDILKLMDIFGIEHAEKMSKEQVLMMHQEYKEMVPKQ